MAKDPYRYFRVEARDLLEQIGKGVMELERGKAPEELVPRLLRLAHTLKGAARVVRQPEIADAAHEMEDRLGRLRGPAESPPRAEFDAVLALVDAAGTRVAALSPPEGQPQSPGDEAFRTLRADVAEMDALLDGIAEAQSSVGSLRDGVASLGEDGRGARPLPADELRAVVTNAERGLPRLVERVERELAAVRGAAERLRLLPASALFASLERTLRDAVRATGRRATFRGEGGEVRLDGHVLAGLQPALTQIVRNAVAHGIEAEAERTRAGKPADGTVVVTIARRGSRVAFRCRDDGRGIDLAAVRTALERKGLAPRAADHEALLQQLLEGGITTSAAVTGLAGRGLGLDVVREMMARLGGHVAIRTEAGAGTTVELDVPVSLSSMEALVVEAAGTRAAIPLDSVRQVIRVGPEDISRSGGGESLRYGDALVPFVQLAQVLAKDAARDTRARAQSAVVVASGGDIAAVGVHRLRGRAGLLVRPLPPLAPVDPVVVGASLDADGNPQPVLDAAFLIQAARMARASRPAPPAPAPILVVDDSLTTRMLEQSILESAGYAVALASSGEEALAKARRQRYSLFLVDVEMPGMDGFALLERLQAETELRAIPAFLVTSRSSEEDRARGMSAGARAYIVKSEFEQGEFLERVRALVGPA